MGVNIQKKKLSDFRSEEGLRYDYKYISSFETSSKEFYSYRQLFDFVSYQGVDISKLEKFRYAEIGNVSKMGEVEPVELSFDDRQEENESLFKKIEKGDIIKPLSGDVLISKIRPYLNKNILIENEDTYFTKAFIQIRPKINSELLHIAIRTRFINLLNAVSRQGKGYPTLKEDDIKSIRFPRNYIDALLNCENELIKKISPLKAEILSLKQSKEKTSSILNGIFANYFNIELSLIVNLDDTKILPIKFSDITVFNPAFRASLRWNKMQNIQSILYSNISCIKTLGRFVKSTKNGWSPLSVEGGEGIPVLGQENFSFDGVLKVEPSKATEETRNNIEDFFIKKGDFFVSRGNTVDLVALASVVNVEIEDDILFPDLYIRLELDEASINKEYLSFIFNSFIGRLYFKYVAKGKNQTMVKVSSTELLSFRLPIPSIEDQENLVGLIKTQLDDQKVIDGKVEEKQQAINKIIQNAVISEQTNA